MCQVGRWRFFVLNKKCIRGRSWVAVSRSAFVVAVHVVLVVVAVNLLGFVGFVVDNNNDGGHDNNDGEDDNDDDAGVNPDTASSNTGIIHTVKTMTIWRCNFIVSFSIDFIILFPYFY